MIMKWLNFKSTLYTVLALFLFCPEDALAQADKSDEEETKDTVLVSKSEPSKYDKRIHRFRKGFSTEPLSCGLYFNTVFRHEFWVKEPSRYPEGYYGFSSKIRTHIFLGQRLTYNIDKDRRFFTKSVTLFYELSTCDLLLISRATNRYLRARDYLSLSFGLKFQWL